MKYLLTVTLFLFSFVAFAKSGHDLVIYNASNMSSAGSTNTIQVLVVNSSGELYLGYTVNDSDNFKQGFVDEASSNHRDMFLSSCTSSIDNLPIKFDALTKELKSIKSFADMGILHKKFSAEDSITQCYWLH